MLPVPFKPRTPEVDCCRCWAVVKVTEPHHCSSTGKTYPPIGTTERDDACPPSALGVPQTLVERQAMHEAIYERGRKAGIADVVEELRNAEHGDNTTDRWAKGWTAAVEHIERLHGLGDRP